MAYGNYDGVYAPYRFRILIPFLWSLFLPIISLNASVLIWNFIFLLGSSLLIDQYLDYFDFSNFYKIIGVLFVNVSFPIIQVAFTPNLDIPLLFFALLFMNGIVKNNPWLIGISSLLGVITKESFLFLFPVYFIYNFTYLKESLKAFWKERLSPNKEIFISIAFLTLAFVEFLWIRNFSFNINFNYDLGKGEFPKYYEKWLSSGGILNNLEDIFLTLTIVWISPIGYLIHKWKLDRWFNLSLYGFFAIFMITLVSGRITRVSFFLIIIYLPIFLNLIKSFSMKIKEESLQE